MKMAKASEKDIDAAGDAMSVLNDISSGYYPKRDGDDCEDLHFDPDEPAHLRKFFNLMADTLDKAPGWPSRVIGGMCYVILFDKNKIVDPDADVLELHPRFSQVQQERDELLAVLREYNLPLTGNEGRDNHEFGVFQVARELRRRAAIAKVEGAQT